MRLPNICSLLTASALLFGANSANAIELTIDDLATGGIEVTRTSVTGAVGYSTDLGDLAIGNFDVVVTTGRGNPFPGAPANTVRTDLDITVAGGPNEAQTLAEEPGTLVITLTDPGLTLQTPDDGATLVSSSFSINDSSNSNTTVESFIRTASSGVFELFSTFTGEAEVNFAEVLGGIITSGEEFDLRTVITVAFDKFGFASTDASVTVAPVPLPAALPLFLTALLGLGFIGRQRRRQTA